MHVQALILVAALQVLSFFAPNLPCGYAGAYDASFDRLFQFNDYCRSKPECFRQRDGTVVLTLAGSQVGGTLRALPVVNNEHHRGDDRRITCDFLQIPGPVYHWFV